MKKLIVLLALLAGCAGSKGTPCYDNYTCDGDLLCVKLGTHDPQCWNLSDILVTERDGRRHGVTDGVCK